MHSVRVFGSAGASEIRGRQFDFKAFKLTSIGIVAAKNDKRQIKRLIELQLAFQLNL